MDEMWYIHAMEYFTAMNMNKPFKLKIITQVNLMMLNNKKDFKIYCNFIYIQFKSSKT